MVSLVNPSYNAIHMVILYKELWQRMEQILSSQNSMVSYQKGPTRHAYAW